VNILCSVIINSLIRFVNTPDSIEYVKVVLFKYNPYSIIVFSSNIPMNQGTERPMLFRSVEVEDILRVYGSQAIAAMDYV
jgi:hypothetical protein